MAAKNTFVCANPDDLTVQGSYQREVGQLIFVDVAKCVNGTDPAAGSTCKSSEEIDRYFAKKYFQVLQNQVRFD